MTERQRPHPYARHWRDSLMDGDEHLMDLAASQRSRFVPARFQWQIDPRTHELTLIGGEFL